MPRPNGDAPTTAESTARDTLREDDRSERLFQPTPRELALLILHLLDSKVRETTREVTRARLSEITLRRLACRTRIESDLLVPVQELLLQAGWALFWGGSTFAVIKVDAINGWPRISSKRIADDLRGVSRGRFEFDPLERLLFAQDTSQEEAED